LGAVAETLWKEGVGSLPVVEDGRVLGVITDRDIAIALGTRNIRAGDTLVREVALPKLFYCAPEDDIHVALQTMRAQRVRRLPVMDIKGALQGILCLDDIILFAEEAPAELTYADVVETLQGVCEHPAVARVLAVAR
jgi:CBS domain-containing protein